MLDASRNQMEKEWQSANGILQKYQDSYDKMFKYRAGSGDFVQFLRNSSKAYWTLGNNLGKVGHAIYCWDVTSKRYPDRKMPWEQLREFITLMSKIFVADKKAATGAAW